MSRDGQVTDRYTKAIEHLGSDKPDMRIGGIYALERIARDSPKDHPAVMEVLAAFIREHSCEGPIGPPVPVGGKPRLRTRPEVQAALTVVGRRRVERDVLPIDLTEADLSYAELKGAKLAKVIFNNARLAAATLDEADLSKAEFYRADLSHANLHNANCTGAQMPEANFKGARLHHANFTDAYLPSANFTDAFLHGANFTTATLDRVKWPQDKPIPAGWKVEADSGLLTSVKTDDLAGPSDDLGSLRPAL